MKFKNLYLLINITGIVINIITITIILNILNFEFKSWICVFIWSFIGYCVKTWIFTIPLLWINKYNNEEQFGLKIFYSVLPLIYMIIWFGCILIFKIEFIYFDFSFGYFQRFPHGLIQILTMFLMSILSITLLNLNRKNI